MPLLILWIREGDGISFFSLRFSFHFPLKKWFVDVFGSVEVENVTVTPATRKYYDTIYEPIKNFLYILRDFHKFH